MGSDDGSAGIRFLQTKEKARAQSSEALKGTNKTRMKEHRNVAVTADIEEVYRRLIVRYRIGIEMGIKCGCANWPGVVIKIVCNRCVTMSKVKLVAA